MSSALTRCSSSLATHCSLILNNARKIIHHNQLMLNCGEFEYDYHCKQADKSQVVVYIDGCKCVYFCNICVSMNSLLLRPIYCESSVKLH